MTRKSLFLFLTIALWCVPVLLIAHAYTHFAQTEALIAPDTEDAGDADLDLDEVCFECLALSTLNVIILYALLFKGVPTRYRLPSSIRDGHGGSPSFTYDSRAPPLI